MDEKILFLGDVLLDRIYDIPHEKYPVIFNLEGPLTNLNTPIDGKINLKSSGELLKKTFKPVPVAVCLANNHIMDYGNEAFLDTIKFLEENNIKYFGAGDACLNYNNPLILNVNNYKIGLLGYCYKKFYDQIKNVQGLLYGPAPIELELIQNDIRFLQNKVDKIFINLHWGIEQSNYPALEQIELARRLADSKVDVIIGHHAHSVQPVEIHKGTIIAYGLGNFIFPDINTESYFNFKNDSSRLYEYKQQVWNKCSAGLIYDFINDHFECIPFYYNNGIVKKGNKYFHKYLSVKYLKGNINRKISRHLKIKKIITRLFNLVKNPRVPKFSNLIEGLKILILKKNPPTDL